MMENPSEFPRMTAKVPAVCAEGGGKESPRMKTSLILCILGLAGRLLAGDAYFPEPDSQGGWREATTTESCRDLAGMDLGKLEPAFVITERSTAHGGLLVVRKGYLCFERYFGRASRNGNPDMASTGKAFCSIACGIMLHEFKDKIPDGLATKVFTERYLPEAFPLNDPRKAEITLGQLLCMTGGSGARASRRVVM